MGTPIIKFIIALKIMVGHFFSSARFKKIVYIGTDNIIEIINLKKIWILPAFTSSCFYEVV